MAGMVLAPMSAGADIARHVSQCQPEFKDCLPPLIA